MAYKKPWRVAGLIALGILVGYVIGPPIVQAATSLVTIQGGGSTHKAKVDGTGRLLTNSKVTGVGTNKASQLLVGQGAPANYRSFFLGKTADCSTPGFTVPAGKALIITETTFFVLSFTPGSEFDTFLETGTGGSCSGIVAIAIDTSGVAQHQSQSYPTGIALPTGTELSLVGNSNGGSFVFIYGYLVPAAAVPVLQGKATPRVPHGGLLVGS